MSPLATRPAFRVSVPLRPAHIARKHFVTSRRVVMPSLVAKRRLLPGGDATRARPWMSRRTRHLKFSAAFFVYRGVKVAAVYGGFDPVLHHLERLTSCSALRQRVEHRNFSQPPAAISNESSCKSHIRSLHAFRRIARASCSFTSAWRGTYSSPSPSVQTSCRLPWRRNRHPHARRRLSSSRFFTFQQECTRKCVASFRTERRQRSRPPNVWLPECLPRYCLVFQADTVPR